MAEPLNNRCRARLDSDEFEGASLHKWWYHVDRFPIYAKCGLMVHPGLIGS